MVAIVINGRQFDWSNCRDIESLQGFWSKDKKHFYHKLSERRKQILISYVEKEIDATNYWFR